MPPGLTRQLLALVQVFACGPEPRLLLGYLQRFRNRVGIDSLKEPMVLGQAGPE